MKPFVAIGRVLDEVSDVVQHLHSVDDCAKTENLYSAFEAVPGPGVSSLEPLRMHYTDSCVSHNRRPKCHRKLPLELHFLPSGRLKFKRIGRKSL